MTANVALSNRLLRFIAYLFLAALIVVIDQWTKYLTVTSALVNAPKKLTSFFNLVYVENKGAAFGILAEAGTIGLTVLIVSSVIIIIGLLVYLWLTPAVKVQMLSLMLILGGAIGNLIDRVRLGYVIDFLDAHWNDIHWPAFNVADAAISGGALLWLFVLLYGHSDKTESTS